jgi:hypothetical protein
MVIRVLLRQINLLILGSAVQHDLPNRRPMRPITTWPTHKVSSQHPASGEAGCGVLALARLISGVIYARPRAAPQRQHLSICRQVVHATCVLMSDTQTLRD